MKFHKLISRTIVATALLGVTFGGALSSSANAFAQQDNSQTSNQPNQNNNPQSSSDDSNTPKYADNGKGNGTSKGTQGSTTVTNGSLTLDSVPTFNFQQSDNSNNNALQLQNSGQDNEKLKITDYRTQDNNNNNDSGWQLQVTSNGFSQRNSQNNNDNNDWKINLNKTSLDQLTGNDGNSITSNTKINQPFQLSTNDRNQNSKPLINNGKYGITQLNYGSDKNSATLNVPNVQPDSNNPYTTSITWNLNTTVNGNVDN